MVRLQEKKIPYNFIHTGQHQATMNEMIRDFGIKSPDKVLYEGPDIVSVPKMFFWIIRILWKSVIKKQEIFGKKEKGIVLVHGDTFSTLQVLLIVGFCRIRQPQKPNFCPGFSWQLGLCTILFASITQPKKFQL